MKGEMMPRIMFWFVAALVAVPIYAFCVWPDLPSRDAPLASWTGTQLGAVITDVVMTAWGALLLIGRS
jgi:hypothetical protein